MSRLEQIDSYLASFEARVVAREDDDRGTWLRLDRSAFYPTSGGQQHDTGSLGEGSVVEVELRGSEVWHRVEGPVPAVGESATGLIDWNRRLRHMQRHTAQHLLSQAFVRVDPRFATRSVSLRGADCTLDLAGDPDAGDLSRAEEVVNEAIYRNLPVDAFEVDEDEIKRYPLRRPPKVSGRIRLVRMGDWELSACGGTHLSSTAQAAPVKILGSERVKGGLVRIVFRAGLEALEDYSLKHEVATELARGFSALPEEVPARVGAMRSELRESRSETSAWRSRYAVVLAAELLAGAEAAPFGRVVSRILDEGEAGALEPLSEALCSHPGTVALLATRGERPRLRFCRSADVDRDMRTALGTALPAVEGRGGGRAELAQGAGTRPEGAQEALDRARAAVLSP